VVVGRVDPQKLNCGPEGNHIKAEISPLAKAKFQFQLCQPFESPFAQDFDTDPNVGEHPGENRTDRRQTKYDRVRHGQQVDQVHM
jgi:hypothetical protein